MSVIVCRSVAFSYGATEILNNITFSVNQSDKVGIIGVNGAGKSTLFSVLRGLLAPSSGGVYVKPDARIGILEQINDAHRFECSVLDAALRSFPELLASEARLEELKIRMESGDADVIKAFVSENERFVISGGNEFRGKTKSLLLKFGFSESDLPRHADTLSGGQKTKLLLVSLLLSEPDIILLDEPTNHLDTDACEWLEGFISSSKKTFLIISHDRYFLDKVTNRTLEISHGISEMYDGGYSVFREKKRALDETAMKHYLLQQKEIKRLEAFIANQRKWNREKNIIAAESRQKTIDKMVKLEKPKEREKGINFSVAHSGAMGHDVLSVRSLGKAFPGNELFRNLSFELFCCDRLFILGANGCGKSTLMKILTGRDLSYSGVYEAGYNQTIGYYDQEQQLLCQENTVFEELRNEYTEKSDTDVRAMLARFGFRGDDVFKPVSVLSGGERARLSIAKMIENGVSLLLLDEPTNHLDIDSREMLEDALASYDGTIIAISHDRYFTRSLATKILEIDRDGYDSGYAFFGCGYEEFLATRRKKEKVVYKNTAGAGKKAFEETRQKKNRLRSAKARFEAVENEIGRLESELSEIGRKLSDDAISVDYIAVDKLTSREADINSLLSKLYSELESLDEEISAADE